MKMVKSLLLGSAAGIVAVAGAQAADLPVKAKPVEYVKVCSLYGAGYYYMPGTDICIKLGGYVRWQFSYGTGNSPTLGPMNGTAGRDTRSDTADTVQRTRALITVDTRQQTAYGTLRTYILLGYSQDSAGALGAETTSPGVYMTRGFIQIAGFTFGKATSFFDIYPNASFGYNVGMVNTPDTGDAGKMLGAYTAQFGNGVSGTIAIEQSRRANIVNTSVAGAYALGALPTTNNLGFGGVAGVSGLPDIVGNIRIDQSWGSWLFGAAAHNDSATYYSNAAGAVLDVNGRPSDKWGWAGTTGFIWNLPQIAAGDRLSAQVVYTEGAIRYASITPTGNSLLKFNGQSVGWGMWEDGVYATGSSVNLTTAWAVAAAFEHLWTPALRTSIYGSYITVSHNAAAVAMICATGITGVTVSATTCNPDFKHYNLGTRTQWEPTPGLIMGVDVLYNKLETATSNNLGTTTLTAASGAKPSGVYTNANQSTWTATFRIQRDFLP